MKNTPGNLLWGLMAFFYDQFFERFPLHQKLRREIIENLKGTPSTKYFLDAGCGTGLLSIELARNGHRVIGVDRSAEMLKLAKKKKQNENMENLHFLKEDLNTGTDLHKYSFYKIFLIHSLYLFKDPSSTLKHLISTLAKGDEIFMCNPCRKLTKGELLAGGMTFLRQTARIKGIQFFIFFLSIVLAIGVLNVVIQHRKKRVYHCWNEEEITSLLKDCGIRVKWMKKSCLGNSHLLICGVKEE